MEIKILEQFKSFAGDIYYYQHSSKTCRCEMTFAVYLPPQAKLQKVPAIFFLSGLTATHENFITKAGAQAYASKLGIALIMPDTSPRNLSIPNAEKGYGAGFYVNAIRNPLAKYFNMYDYVVNELPEVCEKNLPIIASHYSIMGHSMGGHGALMIALRNPQRYQSVSAFAPICAPIQSPWGQDYFQFFLGDNPDLWQQYDTCELIKKAITKQSFFIDQGTADKFLHVQLMPDKLQAICAQYNYPLNLRLQTGYDHSYFFIATFISDHLNYHAKSLLS